MRKVLLITFFYPPNSSIGAQRPYGLSKNLSKFGWAPIILTPKISGPRPDNIRIIETDYKDITKKIKSMLGFDQGKSLHDQLGGTITKNYTYPTWKSKIIKLCKEMLLFPDDKKGWYGFAYKAAKQLLDKEEIHAIISTSPPATAHLIAKRLKRRYNIKWIADFRDPWAQKYINTKTPLMQRLEKRLERRTIAFADMLISVTKPYVDKISILHHDKKIFCIPNGFNYEDFQDLHSELTSKFTITYAGTLYNGRRDPTMLFKVISELIKENKINRDLIEIRFYVPKETWLIDEISKYSLEGVVQLNGFIPREEILKKQSESQLLLLIRWDSKKEIGDCPAKIFEYLGVRRPVVAIGGCGGIVRELLEETNAGKFAETPHELRRIILEYYQEFISKGKVECLSNNNVRNYTYDAISEKYAQVLDMVVQ